MIIMTNREKLSRMALIDLLMYLDSCGPLFDVNRCIRYDGDCYKCRMNWLKEETKERENNDSKRIQ